MPSAPDLPPDYYLANFRFMLDWVAQRYADLLNIQELEFIQAFNRLDHQAQCLLVRLSSRKGPLFRRDKLAYAEIKSLDTAAQHLVAAGLLQQDKVIDLQTLASCLTKPELLLLFGESLAGLKQARKEQLVQTLGETLVEARSWQEWTQGQLGVAWYLDNKPIIRHFLLLFFGNAYQDLTEFVLQDLGLFRYEAYTIDQGHRLFKSREELEAYLLLVDLREQLESCSSASELLQLAAHLPGANGSERLRRRRARFCNQLAYALERSGEHGMANQLYAQSHLPPARERQIRLLEKQQAYEQAWQLLSELIAQPLDEQELQVARRMAPRIAKKLNIAVDTTSVPAISQYTCELPRLCDEGGNPLRVEEIVRLSLHSEEAPCFYTENALLGGLFGLWLWPEMFRGIEGAFANPFQAAPLDLYQEDFATKRDGIQQLWQLLESDTYQQAIREIWREKYGIANHLINWSVMTEELVEIALTNIPATHLALIFQRLLFDIKNNRSGLPDLIQFFPTQKSYRMIEVKGPGDRIQDNQQRWLDFFALHQIPAEVCYVRWQ